MPYRRLLPAAACARCDHHAAGPTACAADPRVMKDIRAAIARERVLSTADARLARRMGLLPIPQLGRTGFNDGVVYPPHDVPTDRPQRPGRVGTAALRPSARAAALRTTGAMNCLVLLVDFSDNPGKAPAQHFEQLLFDRGNPNSMASLYHELSYGSLDVRGSVVGWLRAPQPYAYYTAGESGTGDNFPHNTPGLLHDMLAQYTAQHSLAPFDLNGDGFIDGLFIVHAGSGAEAEPDAERRRHKIWSHKWTLPAPFVDHGVKAYAYFTAPEDGRLGVFAHEFGHFLGLPDLYDTSYRSQGIGDWCLMASGSWNGGGDVPARLSAWCLATLGWIRPTTVGAAATLTLDTLANDRGACWRLWSGGRVVPEYFLIENRRKSGRDAALPGSGLAVWHIDETQGDNTNPIAYRVGLVQADGRRDLELSRNSGDAGDLFPGSRRRTACNDKPAVQPTLRANDGSPTGLALSAIKTTRGIVSLKVKV